MIRLWFKSGAPGYGSMQLQSVLYDYVVGVLAWLLFVGQVILAVSGTQFSYQEEGQQPR